MRLLEGRDHCGAPLPQRQLCPPAAHQIHHFPHPLIRPQPRRGQEQQDELGIVPQPIVLRSRKISIGICTHA